MRTAITIGFVLILCGCDLTGATTTQLDAQSGRIEELEKKVGQLENQVFFLELSKNPFETASFDPAADEGFQRIDTSVGTFAVSVEEVKAHADGVKVRLSVGNLTSATVSGATFKVKWGARRGNENFVEWQKALGEKEQKVTEDLRPGTWNPVTLTLPGLPPDKFGYLELGMQTSQIRLVVRK